MVNNDHDFATKVETTINIASSILGLPTDIKLYKKFLVDSTTAYVENEDDFGGGSHSVIKFLEDSQITDLQSVKETYLVNSDKSINHDADFGGIRAS